MPRDDQLAREAEHPVVRRLRHRRLLAFLQHQGLDGTFESMVHETEAFFSVAHLQDLMKQGQWRDALAYLSRFLQLDDDRLLSLEAQVLYRFLNAHRNLADILAGNKEGRVLSAFFSKYRIHDRNFCHGNLRLKSIMLTVLHAKQLLSTGRRCCRKKHPCQSRASALAKRYLQRRGSLLSSSDSKESANELYVKAANWVADILDESLKAGKHLELHQKHPLQTTGKQGAIVAPSSNTTSGSLASPVKNPGSMSVENGGTTKHSSQVGCNAESVCQNLNPRKNPRDVTASDEHNRHPKKQRTSGAFAEASMRAIRT